MNIVIKAGSASLTQFNSNLTYALSDIKIYAESNITLEYIEFIADGLTYPGTISAVVEDNLQNFNCYTAAAVISENTYTLIFTTADGVQISVATPIRLNPILDTVTHITDEHNALLVLDRFIQVIANQVMLVAEDAKSQQIRFKIKKKYDNVSFLDATKTAYVDFIPAEWDIVKEELSNMATDDQKIALEEMSFIHSVVDSIEDIDNDSMYAYIRWTVSYVATMKAGALTVALSIADNNNSEYLWQTTPVKLTVQPNIGKRSLKGNIEIATANSINARLVALEEIFSGEDDAPVVTIVGESEI